MTVWSALLAVTALGAGVVLGRASVPGTGPAHGVAAPWSALRPVADLGTDAPPGTATPGTATPGTVPGSAVPGDPREVVPLLPGPGRTPGEAPPGPGQGAGECTVLMFRDGQFYRMQPGPAPGAPPGPGTPGPGGDGEVFPLQPTPAPAPDPFAGPEMRT